MPRDMPSTAAKTLPQRLAEEWSWARGLAVALAGPAGADDLLHDATEDVLRKPPAADRPLRPWLRSVLRNRARMTWRSRERRERREQQAQIVAEAPQSVDTRLASLRSYEHLVRAVIELSPIYRDVIVMRFVDDKPPQTIAEELGISPATVRSRLKRALEQLRRQLEAESAGAPYSVLLPLAHDNSTSLAGKFLGGLAMKKVAIFGAVALSLGSAALLVSNSGSSGESPTSHAQVAETEDRTSGSLTPRQPPRLATKNEPTFAKRFASPAARERFATTLSASRARADKPPTLEVPAKLDRDYIQSAMQDIVPLLAECYTLALVEAPGLTGRFNVTFTIEAEPGIGGYVSENRIREDSTLKDPRVSECVTATISTLEFPSPQDGGTVTVNYPLVFNQSDDD